MRIGRCARLLCVAVVFLAGCSNFWDPPSSSGSGGPTPTTLSSGYFYVLNQTTKQIVAYNINTGKLNQIGAYTLAAAPSAVAIAPGGGFLYVSTAVGIYLYNIGTNGSLTVGGSGNVVSSDPASAIAVDTSGAWLVDAVPGTNGFQVNATPITSSGTFTGGTVASVSFAVNTTKVHQLTVSGDDLNVFVAADTGGMVVVPFAAGNSNPLGQTATVIAPVTSGGAALSVAVDPAAAPRLFYIGESLASGGTKGGLRVFNYSSLGGTLTQVSGSPFASGGTGPNAILPIASGDHVYVANSTGLTSAGNITGFSIASSNGSYTVTTGSTASAGIQPFGLAEDSSSNFVLAVSLGGSPDLDAYIFDTTTAGKLDSSITSTNGTDPTQAIAVAAP